MIKQLATSIAQYSVTHDWMESSQYDWCRYALEKQLCKTLFFLVCLVLTIITHLWIQVGAFVCTFYFFRCRMGGWHASAIWSCQILSFGLLIGITFFIGPVVEYIPLFTLIAIDTVMILVTYFVHPIYPLEAHFTQEIKRSNIQKKNTLLLILVVLQCLSLLISKPEFLSHSMLGLVFTDVSVLLQYFKLKNGRMSQS